MGKNRMLGEIKSHVDSCHSQKQLFRNNNCFKQTFYLRLNLVSPELICGTAGQTSSQTVDWLRSRIFHNVDANSDSSFNLISISLLDLLFHGYSWKIPVRHVITSCTGQSPCLVELHGTHFFPFLVSRIKANLNSPYDDVVPGIPGHSESFGLGYVACVFVSFICLL